MSIQTKWGLYQGQNFQAEDNISTEKHHGKVKKGQSLCGEKENDKITLLQDPLWWHGRWKVKEN